MNISSINLKGYQLLRNATEKPSSYISSGISRTVYRITDDLIVKIGSGYEGSQSKTEIQLWTNASPELQKILCPILAYHIGEESIVTLMPYATPFNQVLNSVHWVEENKGIKWHEINEHMLSIYVDDEHQSLQHLLYEKGVSDCRLPGNERNWGLLNGRLVLLDYGLCELYNGGVYNRPRQSYYPYQHYVY